VEIIEKILFMKKIAVLFSLLVFPVLLFAQNAKYFEVNDIRYRVINEPDASSSVGTVSVAIPEFGEYEDDIVIPNVVKESKEEFSDAYKVIGIDAEAFGQTQHLKSVKLPASIEFIGEKAFWLSNLSSIEIPIGNLQTIPEQCFYNCINLQKCDIPSTIKTIGRYAFHYCTSLRNLTLHEGTETIDNFAFSWCDNLNTVQLPNSLRIINDYAFEYCYRLEKVSLGSGLKRIGPWAFSKCVRLRSIEIPNGLREIGEGAFFYTGITYFSLPESIKEIPLGCFLRSFVREVIASSSIRRVGSSILSYCNIDKISLPETAEIDEQAFRDTTMNAHSIYLQYEAILKKRPSLLIKKVYSLEELDISMDNDHWSRVEYTINGSTYTPIQLPSKQEQYGILKVIKSNGEIPHIIEITGSDYPEKYFIQDSFLQIE